MRLTYRFVLLIGALLFSVAASCVAAWSALSRVEAAMDNVASNETRRLVAIYQARTCFHTLVTWERDYLLSTSTKERLELEQDMSNTARELGEQLDKYQVLMPAVDSAALTRMRRAYLSWLVGDARMLEALRQGNAASPELLQGHAAEHQAWEDLIGSLVRTNEARLVAELAATHATYRSAIQTLTLVSVVAGLFAAGLGYIVFRDIRRNMLEIVELNTNLESIVQVRTEALAERERSLRLLLDSTGEGIIGVSPTGVISGPISAAAARWFGEAAPGTAVVQFLFPNDAKEQDQAGAALEQLLDGHLPWDILVDQMPRRIEKDGLILDLDYREASTEQTAVKLLVLLRDVTARISSERGEQAVREQQRLVAKLLADKRDFALFVGETERLLNALSSIQDVTTARRDLHTLKGNVATFGLTSLSHLCHEIEDRLADSGGLPSASEVADLAALFRAKLKGLEDFLTGVGRKIYEVDSSEHGALIDSLIERKDYPQLLKMVEEWSWPRTAERLARLRGHAEYWAKRLDKPLDVSVEDNQLRLPGDYLERFWPTLSHVIRNAVDHGIEPAGERAARGKPDAGSLVLRTWQTDDSFCVEVKDDGGGVDIEALRSSAAARLGPAAEGTDWVELLFHEGLSTRRDVNEVSGRGVGLAATRAACLAEGGTVRVTSENGRGSSFVFSFRKPVVKTESVMARAEKHWSLLPWPQ